MHTIVIGSVGTEADIEKFGDAWPKSGDNAKAGSPGRSRAFHYVTVGLTGAREPTQADLAARYRARVEQVGNGRTADRDRKIEMELYQASVVITETSNTDVIRRSVRRIKAETAR